MGAPSPSSASPPSLETPGPSSASPTATPSVAPTETSTAAPTTPPTATATAVPPTAPAPALSSVVRARHSGVWDGDTLVPEALKAMLDAAITALTGLDEAQTAWALLFDPGERIAIKVNTIASSAFWTHVPLVLAVAQRLQTSGVPPEQIVIFDRDSGELADAGFPINPDGPGVRCDGTDGRYTGGWAIMDEEVGLSDVLLNCDALINMPILKEHGMSGISFAMKNHYGTFDRPGRFHTGRMERGIAELNALSAIKDRTRLIIGDALAIVRRGWGSAAIGDSLFMSFDPVAHDTAGLQLYAEVMTGEGINPDREAQLARTWLDFGAELGLGTSDPDGIAWVEVQAE